MEFVFENLQGFLFIPSYRIIYMYGVFTRGLRRRSSQEVFAGGLRRRSSQEVFAGGLRRRSSQEVFTGGSYIGYYILLIQK